MYMYKNGESVESGISVLMCQNFGKYFKKSNKNKLEAIKSSIYITWNKDIDSWLPVNKHKVEITSAQGTDFVPNYR